VSLVVPRSPLRLVALAVTGASLAVPQSATQPPVQLYAAPEMRGRARPLHGMIFRGAPAVGALLLGALSERLGLEASFAAGAAVALIFCGWGWWRRLQIAGELDRRPLDTVRIIV